VRLINWKLLAFYQYSKFGQLFNVIYMDPPWRINLKLKYPTLSDNEIMGLPFSKLLQTGYIFCWIVDIKEEIIKQRFKHLGYECKGRITWLKRT
jgi:N6-adenosine-specific RNA methylase IME4